MPPGLVAAFPTRPSEYAANAGATRNIPGVANARPAVSRWQIHGKALPHPEHEATAMPSRSPVGCFPANAFGLYDMIGNVWEWTDNGPQTDLETVYTIKGGSFLCAPNFCRRYRRSAPSQRAGLPTSHIGFRTVSK
ncbi:MAG: hypothetical protein CM15mP21_6300 [Hyphomicrobiales bacterium]|nr:MAG: hypothetical protein CM15mP21_6300 [Hyphomicrobiales bacterium]